MHRFSKLILKYLRILVIFITAAASAHRTTYVVCQPDAAHVRILDTSQSGTTAHTRPDANTCASGNASTNGAGAMLRITAPLGYDKEMEECGVVHSRGMFTLVVDTRRHSDIMMASDDAFLIQCSDSSLAEPSTMPPATIPFSIKHNENPISETMEGRTYTLEVILPNGHEYFVSNCVAFTGGETIHFVPLLDEFGCPVDPATMTPFITNTEGRARAELIIFRLAQSSRLSIQCTIGYCASKIHKNGANGNQFEFDSGSIDFDLELNKCPDLDNRGRKCSDRGGRVPEDLMSVHSTLDMNKMHALVSVSVTVLHEANVLRLQQVSTCTVSTDGTLAALAVSSVLLVLLALAAWLMALCNKPFKVNWEGGAQSRGAPVRGELALPPYRMLPYSVALPPMSQTEAHKAKLQSSNAPKWDSAALYLSQSAELHRIASPGSALHHSHSGGALAPAPGDAMRVRYDQLLHDVQHDAMQQDTLTSKRTKSSTLRSEPSDMCASGSQSGRTKHSDGGRSTAQSRRSNGRSTAQSRRSNGTRRSKASSKRDQNNSPDYQNGLIFSERDDDSTLNGKSTSPTDGMEHRRILGGKKKRRRSQKAPPPSTLSVETQRTQQLPLEVNEYEACPAGIMADKNSFVGREIGREMCDDKKKLRPEPPPRNPSTHVTHPSTTNPPSDYEQPISHSKKLHRASDSSGRSQITPNSIGNSSFPTPPPPLGEENDFGNVVASYTDLPSPPPLPESTRKEPNVAENRISSSGGSKPVPPPRTDSYMTPVVGNLSANKWYFDL